MSANRTSAAIVWSISPTRKKLRNCAAGCRRRHVSGDTPPTLIIHGDADKLVPIQQAKVMVEHLKAAGVPTELVVKKGAGHGWGGMDKDMGTILDWFDKYLKKH